MDGERGIARSRLTCETPSERRLCGGIVGPRAAMLRVLPVACLIPIAYWLRFSF